MYDLKLRKSITSYCCGKCKKYVLINKKFTIYVLLPFEGSGSVFRSPVVVKGRTNNLVVNALVVLQFDYQMQEVVSVNCVLFPKPNDLRYNSGDVFALIATDEMYLEQPVESRGLH